MTKPRILLVEDESILRMDIREMLEESGYEVVGEAGDGVKAIELAHRLLPDLIIMDVKMPKMNGMKASKVISKSLSIPILLLTAYSQRDLVEEARNALITGYLVKPIRESDLIPAVEIAIEQGRRISLLEEGIEQLEEKLRVRKLMERAKGVIMEQNQWSEQQAFEWMRDYCMKKRIQMEALALEIMEKESVRTGGMQN